LDINENTTFKITDKGIAYLRFLQLNENNYKLINDGELFEKCFTNYWNNIENGDIKLEHPDKEWIERKVQ